MSTDEAADVPHEQAASSEDLSTEASPSKSGLAAAAVAVAGLSALSSVLGLVRDLSLAGFFGASGATDAFLVAWTVPETVTPLLLEGAMTSLLVPLFVAELVRQGSINRLVRLTLLPYLFLLLALTVLSVAAAPVFVKLLAPDLSDPGLAAQCFRYACLTLFFMGVAGYLVAALRAHDSFVRPALIYAAYNVGILTCMFLWHARLGVLSAAIGLAVGSVMMVAVQLPHFLRLISLRGLQFRISRKFLIAATAFLPIAIYTLGRQAQVFVERIVGSMLGAGSISYMNYASKVGQIPLMLVLSIATVAFPSLARAAATSTGVASQADRVLRQVVLMTLPAMMFLIVFAHPVVRFMFERGAFDASDTAATAGVLMFYTFGLLGQVLVSVGTLVAFAQRGQVWMPAVAAGACLLVTIVLDVTLSSVFGVRALGIGNASGITVAAIVVLVGLNRSVGWEPGKLNRLLLVATPLAVAAAVVARLLCNTLDITGLPELVLGSATTAVLFAGVAVLVRMPEALELSDTVLKFVRNRRPKAERRR